MKDLEEQKMNLEVTVDESLEGNWFRQETEEPANPYVPEERLTREEIRAITSPVGYLLRVAKDYLNR